MKGKMKLRTKKIFISLGVATAIASPVVTVVSCGNLNPENANGLNSRKTDDYGVYAQNTRYEHKELIYYLNHREELWNLIRDDYEILADEFSKSEIANNWVNSIANKDITDLDAILDSLSTLKVDEGLRLFILQNLYEKVDIYKFGKYSTKSNAQVNRSYNAGNYIKDANFVDGGGYGGSETTTQPELPVLPDKFEFYRVSVSNAVAWDIGEQKGDIDPITGQYYSVLLSQLAGRGWDNTDADSGFTSKRITFEFREISTSRVDSFSLLYNTARDTNGNNEDYTFVAIEPRDSHHITTDHNGNRVPSIFGMPISFTEIQLSSNAHKDNAYVVSHHSQDKGDDSNGGNVLEGIPNAPILDMLDGHASLNHVAFDIWNSVNLRLNYNPDRRNNPLDKNFIYVSGDEEPDDIAYSEYFKNQNSGERIFKNGFDHTYEDYGMFASDITTMHWSNQTVLDTSLQYIYPLIEQCLQLIKDAYESIGDAAETMDNEALFLSIAHKIGETQYETMVSKLVNATGWVGFTSRAISGTWIGSAMSLALADYSSFHNFMDSMTNLVISFSPRMIRWATEFIASATMSGAVEAAIPVVGWIALATQALFSIIPSGNGHSYMSNVNDHGLNDWDSQWKTNQETMTRIAYNFSNDYQDGIVWRVDDSWGGLPELRIKTEGEEDSMYVYLSGGDSFNYGHNIALVDK